MMDEVYVKMSKWAERWTPDRGIIILWSDHTWEEFSFKHNNDNIRDYKKFFNLRYLVGKKMKKKEAIRYLEDKIFEIELYK